MAKLLFATIATTAGYAFYLQPSLTLLGVAIVSLSILLALMSNKQKTSQLR